MLGHPGKKLLFMGQEFAQLQEWSEARELDWYLLAEDKHQQMQNYVKALLHLYKRHRHFMMQIRIHADLNGSMQMMPTEAFSALCVIPKTVRAICSL